MRALVLLALLPTALFAETVVSTRIIRAGSILNAGDLTHAAGSVGDAFENAADLYGLEARVILYPGRPIRFDDVGAPAIVLRNQIVPLRFDQAGLTIVTEGRVLGRGGIGDAVRVINISSRNTVTGVVQADGSVRVGETLE